MVDLVFYEKPGCITNAKQKQLLKKAGVKLLALDLIQHDWSKEALLPFFDGLPVQLWFNQNAPQVKSGDIVPGRLRAEDAIQLLLANPILIRRPLIECQSEKWAGFDIKRITDKLGIKDSVSSTSVTEFCSNPSSGE